MKLLTIFVLVVATILAACSLTNIPSTLPSPQSPPILQTPRAPLDIISDTGYMQECIVVYGKASTVQVTHKGAIPGITTSSEIEQLFGKPLRIYSGWFETGSTDESQWEFEDLRVTYFDNVVQSVEIQNVQKTLVEMVHQYGCPQMIRHRYDIDILTQGEQYTGDEEAPYTIFSYLSIGLEYFFPGFPIRLNQTAEFYVVFSPTSLEDYLSSDENSRGDFLSWGDVIGK